MQNSSLIIQQEILEIVILLLVIFMFGLILKVTGLTLAPFKVQQAQV
jgi:hypothetical protein